MTLALLIGSLAVAIVTLAALVFRRAPTHALCPECGSRTRAVRSHAILRRTEKFVRRRWCRACGWEGRGRAGPEWVPGRPAAHDSGFHWGEERLPQDFGFQWAVQPASEPVPAEPPHHPSGFRFSAPPATESSGAEREMTTRSHPSGFRWARPSAPGATFTWASPSRRPDDPSGFQWRNEED